MESTLSMNGLGDHIRVLALLILVTFSTNSVLAQAIAANQSSLRVTVLDPDGAAIAGARVRLSVGGRPVQTRETNQRGEVVFSRLRSGQYQLHVEAEGFEPYDISHLVVEAGRHDVEVRLQVKAIEDQLEVATDKLDALTDPGNIGLTTVLTEEQIRQMPDDPEEFEAALRQMAGPGSTIRVNGFHGGRLPPKSQIREIRFRLNPYDAENHEAGLMTVDVLTKPGTNLWHGSLNLSFRDEALNARNAFARFRGPEQHRQFNFSLDGPMWRNRTSLFLSTEGRQSYDSQTIVAALPEGPFNDLVRRPSRMLNASARVEHVLTKTHTLRAEYQRNANRQDNLGVGNFDLPERAFSTDVAEHVFRVSDTGLLTSRVVNDFRFQTRWQETDSQSVTNSPAILVLNAFNQGGAQVQSNRRNRELELTDILSFARGPHAMKAGFTLEAGRYRTDALQNANGTFTFASLDAFRAGRPTTYTQRFGDPSVAFSQYRFGWFWQDDWRWRKNVSLSFGLRHEAQSQLHDRNNLAPRVGISWSPFKSGKTTLRAGAGIFYDWVDAEVIDQTRLVDGQRQRDLVVREPGFPDPLAGGMPVVLPSSRIQLSPTLVMPTVEQVSFGVERQLPAMAQVRVNYIYQRGVHLLRGHNVNAPIPGLGRPDPTAGNINQVESVANSWLHLVNVNVGRISPRFHLMFNYTWMKATDEADSALALPADNFNLRAERGPAAWDSRHRLFAMWQLTLPKGFRLGSLFHANSATPYNVTTGFDDNGDTVSNDRPVGVSRNSARGAAHWDLSTRLSWGIGFGHRRESSPRPAVLAIRGAPGADILGSLPSGPSNNLARLEFYVQLYNLFNHANLTNFTGVQTSPFFGQATAAQPGRRIQSGVRISF